MNDRVEEGSIWTRLSKMLPAGSAKTQRWDDQSWRDEAECLSLAVALFFPVAESNTFGEEVDTAKAVCRMCPVRDHCLEFALKTGQTEGVWGGTSEAERRRIRRARQKVIRRVAVSAPPYASPASGM